MPARSRKAAAPALKIRRVRASDLSAVATLDRRVTGIAKMRYWRDVFERYGRRRLKERFFLVAEPPLRAKSRIVGFIIGEVRAWEFGSAPCGWVFALSVEPEARLSGVGHALLAAIAAEFRRAGVAKMRTMVERDNSLPMLFFRSEGLIAGPYVQLERDID